MNWAPYFSYKALRTMLQCKHHYLPCRSSSSSKHCKNKVCCRHTDTHSFLVGVAIAISRVCITTDNIAHCMTHHAWIVFDTLQFLQWAAWSINYLATTNSNVTFTFAGYLDFGTLYCRWSWIYHSYILIKRQLTQFL